MRGPDLDALLASLDPKDVVEVHRLIREAEAAQAAARNAEVFGTYSSAASATSFTISLPTLNLGGHIVERAPRGTTTDTRDPVAVVARRRAKAKAARKARKRG